MLWHRLTGSLLLGLGAVCAFLGFERMRDFADSLNASPLRDLVFAAAWWLLLTACLIAAFYDFRRGQRRG